jgi:hypothetical protein
MLNVKTESDKPKNRVIQVLRNLHGNSLQTYVIDDADFKYDKNTKLNEKPGNSVFTFYGISKLYQYMLSMMLISNNHKNFQKLKNQVIRFYEILPGISKLLPIYVIDDADIKMGP